ncbi:hypothetical protein NQ315_002553 [Exocentrus adspersus]|uniref:Beta-hexosaminidase n=1 Tax=Exocentrus adspersus TaxID=1586481 RepID=A0AAV8VF71_9CUCU|nr:hypothetical protein NQ315_002553 [Exocentrus adspersus]
MRYEVKRDRILSIMRPVALFLLLTLFVYVVYAADVTELLTGSIHFIDNQSGDSEISSTTHTCEDKCSPKETDTNEISNIISLKTCIMLCGDLPIWPKPMNINVKDKDVSTFSKNRIGIKLNAPVNVRGDLKKATDIFMKNLPVSDEFWIDEDDSVLFNIYINVIDIDNVLRLSTNEEYALSVKKVEDHIDVELSAPTYFGARNGLETLIQLIWSDTTSNKLHIIHDVEIKDKPKFAHRGVMVDTARNYFYIEQLRKVVDGMAATKLNVLHLHLTDASSFPVVLPRNTLFAKYGAYDPEMVYSPENVKDLVEYARIRGIRVVLEIDGPSHVPPALNRAVEDLVVCGEDAVFNGHLNPENNKTFLVLEDIYKDLLDLGTDDEMFHIGGDEVNLTCWQQTVSNSPKQQLHHKAKHSTAQANMMKIWINFTNRMLDTVISAKQGDVPQHIVIWSSDLTDRYISQLDYKNVVVVQYWFGSINPIFANGNKVILSTVGRWYLDCGFGSWKSTNSRDNGVCDPYTTWHTFYKYRPWVDEFPTHKDQVLGGEACLWSEEVGADSLETRIWPRAAALAERLWSDPDVFNRTDVYVRLDIHRERLTMRGIRSEAIWPRWCSQNPWKC